MTPKVLFLFAGAKRKGDFGTELRNAAKERFPKVIVHDIDILRGGARDDLLSKAKRTRLLAKIAAGEYDMVAASPPCETYSRATFANRMGPRPSRSKAHPWGLPWLRHGALAKAKAANKLVKFTMEALFAQSASKNRTAFLLEHPENLGRTREGKTPASIWQLDEVREVGLQEGTVCGALHQSDWGVSYAKPTRLMGRLDGLDGVVKVGSPTFDKDDVYTGPLEKCTSASASLLGKSGAYFRTHSAAAWPR